MEEITRFKKIEKIMKEMQDLARKKCKGVQSNLWTTNIVLWTDQDFTVEMTHRGVNIIDGIELYSFLFDGRKREGNAIIYREHSVKTEGGRRDKKQTAQERAIYFINRHFQSLDKKTTKKLLKNLAEGRTNS